MVSETSCLGQKLKVWTQTETGVQRCGHMYFDQGSHQNPALRATKLSFASDQYINVGTRYTPYLWGRRGPIGVRNLQESKGDERAATKTPCQFSIKKKSKRNPPKYFTEQRMNGKDFGNASRRTKKCSWCITNNFTC